MGTIRGIRYMYFPSSYSCSNNTQNKIINYLYRHNIMRQVVDITNLHIRKGTLRIITYQHI